MGSDYAYYEVTEYGLEPILAYDMKYWTFISEELPEICHELFPQLTTKREKTYAAGLSMGGYGALKLGLAKPENFAAIISLSGAISVGNRMDDLLMIRKAKFWEGVFGPLDQIKGSVNDPQYLLEELVKSDKTAPRIYLACGESDFLYQANQEMTDSLKANGIGVTFEHGPGEHNWVFWDQWIQRALEWLFEEK